METEIVIPILIVDDEQINLTAMEAILQQPDYRLIKASSGEDALRHLLTTDFAVILLDVYMPGLDGIETLRLLRQSGRHRETPVIFLTATDEDLQRAMEGYELGAVDYLFKPIVINQTLSAKVALFANLYRQRIKLEQTTFELVSEVARRKQAEENLERANQELEVHIQERTAKLKAATMELNELYQQAESSGLTLLSVLEDQQQIENALRESEERLRLSTEMANVAVWEYNFATNSMSRSKNHDSLYGLEWQTSWNRNTFLNATHPDDRELSNATIQKSVAIGSPDHYKFDFRVVYSDQTIHWLAVTGQVVERDTEGRGILVRGVLIDITERKKAETALKEAEEKYKASFDNSRDAIDIFSQETNILAANIELKKLSGYSEAELLSMTLVNIFPEADKLASKKRIRDMINGKIILPFETQLLTKQGISIPVEISVALLQNCYGQDFVFQGNIRDITERKQAQEELKARMEDLDKFNKLMIGRENKMADLKKEINILLEQLGLPKKYKDIDFIPNI